jgi:hypothetical protein
MAGKKKADDGNLNDTAAVLYEELVSARDRLGDFSPLTPLDLEQVARAMHEVVFFVITPPRGAGTPLPLPDRTKGQLVAAARNRDLDLYVTAVALIARKAALRRGDGDQPAAHLDSLRNALDALTFDYRRPKRETLATLRAVRSDLDARIGYVIGFRDLGYRFRELPEAYAARLDKKERPDQFFQRVYGAHVPRGLTQADIRKVDPAYYNVLHVWCTRHKRRLSALVPATRARRD